VAKQLELHHAIISNMHYGKTSLLNVILLYGTKFKPRLQKNVQFISY